MKRFNEIITEQFKYSDGVLNALKEVGIGIYEIKEHDWLNRQGLLLDDEKEKKEFRIKLSKIYTEEIFQDNWGNFLEDDKYKEEIENDKKRIGKVEEPDRYNESEFSVFLPKSVKFHDKNSDKYDIFVAACMTQASLYFKTLNGVPDVYNKFFDWTDALHEPVGLGKFLNYHMTLIDNQNIEKLKNAIYRLHKDSKFFYELQELLEKSDYEWLMNEFSKIVK